MVPGCVLLVPVGDGRAGCTTPVEVDHTPRSSVSRTNRVKCAMILKVETLCDVREKGR